MSPESVAEKASRYLIEGRLIVERVDEARIAARCRGRGTQHRLGWEHEHGWYCTCLARNQSRFDADLERQRTQFKCCLALVVKPWLNRFASCAVVAAAGWRRAFCTHSD